MPGIFLNIDINTVTFPFLERVSKSDRVTEADLYPFIDQYVGTQITDVAINVFCQISMTPSDVWSDALDTYYRTEENGVPVDYKSIMEHYHRMYEVHKIDPHAVWFARCREKGLTCWLSVRMNDCHCPAHKAVWIRGSEFYEADEKGWKIGDAYGYQRHCYDYANPEFRARMLAYIEEQVMRYDADGLELDFSREWFCFDTARTPDPSPIMTAFVREVKRITDRAAEKWGHPVLIHMRLMRDIEQNRMLGFDAEALIEEGLLDNLSVAPRWGSNDSHLPVAAWKHRFPDFPIYAGITDLTLLGFSDHETVAGYAASFLAQGADKIYLYNFFTNPDNRNEAYARMHRTCGELATLSHVSRRIPVTLQDVAPLGVPVWCPLPAAADGFTLSVPTGPVAPDEEVAIVLGFDREIKADEITVTLNGTPARLLGATHHADAYASGRNQYAGYEAAKALYLFSLPRGVIEGTEARVTLTAADRTLTVSYLEADIGDTPKTDTKQA